MNRYQRTARKVLAQRLRSMIPDQQDFENKGLTPEEVSLAMDYHVAETEKLARRLDPQGEK